MIEILISMTILFMVMPVTYLLMSKLYTQYNQIRILNDLKQSSDLAFAKIDRDIRGCKNCDLSPDNHGLNLTTDSGRVGYFLNKGNLCRSGDGRSRVMSQAVRDCTFLQHGGTITMNIELSFMNINTRKEESIKFLHSFLSGSGGL
jgi:hypothetical protein